jgi:pilus assembly protein CpaD
MNRSVRSAALLALSLGVAACAGTENRGLESVHQPIVSRTDYALDVATTSDGLGSGEAARLAGWLDMMKLSYGDSISVDQGGGYGTPDVRDDVADVAAKYGVLLADNAPVTVGQIAPGTARIVVTRSRAEVPNCPDFSRVSSPNFDNHTSSNFGCGLNSTFAGMVANPEDMVRGRDSTGDSNVRNEKAFRAYMSAEPTGSAGIKAESSKEGGSN